MDPSRRSVDLVQGRNSEGMSLESMENEMFVIKKQVFEKKPEQKPPPGYMYPTFAEPAKRSET